MLYRALPEARVDLLDDLVNGGVDDFLDVDLGKDGAGFRDAQDDGRADDVVVYHVDGRHAG